MLNNSAMSEPSSGQTVIKNIGFSLAVIFSGLCTTFSTLSALSAREQEVFFETCYETQLTKDCGGSSENFIAQLDECKTPGSVLGILFLSFVLVSAIMGFILRCTGQRKASNNMFYASMGSCLLAITGACVGAWSLLLFRRLETAAPNLFPPETDDQTTLIPSSEIELIQKTARINAFNYYALSTVAFTTSVVGVTFGALLVKEGANKCAVYLPKWGGKKVAPGTGETQPLLTDTAGAGVEEAAGTAGLSAAP